MGSRPARHRYCRCGTHLAANNPGRQCARCQRGSRDKLIAPPQVPPEFWDTEQFRQAFAAQHIGWVSRTYRTHPDQVLEAAEDETDLAAARDVLVSTERRVSHREVLAEYGIA